MAVPLVTSLGLGLSVYVCHFFSPTPSAWISSLYLEASWDSELFLSPTWPPLLF